MKIFIYSLELQDCPSTGRSPSSLLFSLLEGEWASMWQVLSGICYTVCWEAILTSGVLRREGLRKMAGLRAYQVRLKSHNFPGNELLLSWDTEWSYTGGKGAHNDMFLTQL